MNGLAEILQQLFGGNADPLAAQLAQGGSPKQLFAPQPPQIPSPADGPRSAFAPQPPPVSAPTGQFPGTGSLPISPGVADAVNPAHSTGDVAAPVKSPQEQLIEALAGVQAPDVKQPSASTSTAVPRGGGSVAPSLANLLLGFNATPSPIPSLGALIRGG